MYTRKLLMRIRKSPAALSYVSIVSTTTSALSGYLSQQTDDQSACQNVNNDHRSKPCFIARDWTSTGHIETYKILIIAMKVALATVRLITLLLAWHAFLSVWSHAFSTHVDMTWLSSWLSRMPGRSMQFAVQRVRWDRTGLKFCFMYENTWFYRL